jgi:ceramide glucosyltransferase
MSLSMTPLDLFFLTLVSAGLFFHLLGAILLGARRFFPRPALDPAPPITVLKPLAGAIPGLEKALESFLTQTHPNTQVLFGVATEDDPARGVARELIERHPSRDAAVVVGGPPLGPNRKAANLHYMLGHAKHDLLLVSDDDVVAGPDHLSRLAGELSDPKAGLVTTPYFVRPSSLPLALHSLTMATEFFPGVVVAGALGGGLSFALGASSLLRRPMLEEIGGFKGLVDFLADDYLLGWRARQKGWSVQLSRERVQVDDHFSSLGDFFVHQARWSRTYRVCQPVGFFLSLLTHSLSWAALYVAASGASPRSLLLGGAAGLLRILLAASQILAQGPPLLLAWLWLVPVRDLLSTVFWALSFLGSEVRWRGLRYRVRPGGRLEPLG